MRNRPDWVRGPVRSLPTIYLLLDGSGAAKGDRRKWLRLGIERSLGGCRGLGGGRGSLRGLGRGRSGRGLSVLDGSGLGARNNWCSDENAGNGYGNQSFFDLHLDRCP